MITGSGGSVVQADPFPAQAERKKNLGDPYVEISHASKSVGRKTLWSDVDLTVNSGMVSVISGESGCGKSTLLECIAGLTTLDSGTISVLGQQVTALSAGKLRRFRRDHIGLLVQDGGVVDDLSVHDNLRLATGDVPWRKRHQTSRYDQALAEVSLQGRLKDKGSVLSEGEKHRVNIARILLRNPDIILADEPTASLDAKNSAMVTDALQALAQKGAAVLIVSHDPEVWDIGERHWRLSTDGVILV